jgi:lysophospholipase L1-like esterase
MKLGFILASLAFAASLFAGEGVVIDSMDEASFVPADAKKGGKVELVDGKFGKAVKFVFPDNNKNIYLTKKLKTSSEWDAAAGFSFWLKGDGSQSFGNIELVWNDDYGLRYDYAFPIDSSEWVKVVVPWRDLTPGLPKLGSKPIDAKGNAPSKFTQLWFGKWFFWREYPVCSFTIDEIRLEPTIELDTSDYKPAGAPLARVLAKLKAKQPITIVTMGDSLTDYKHWSNKETNWPTMLKKQLKEKYGSEVTIVNPAIGGNQLRQGLIQMIRWSKPTPEPDLVTVFYGGNDWEDGMRGDLFFDTQKETIDRIRRTTKGKADVLILSTAPSVKEWDTFAELAEACQKASKEKNAGLADVYAAFHAACKDEKVEKKEPDPAPAKGEMSESEKAIHTQRAKLFAKDEDHLGPAGQEIVAKLVLEAIEKAGAP